MRESVRDRAISAAVQRRPYEVLPCERVPSLATDHSPSLSQPGPLLHALATIAGA